MICSRYLLGERLDVGAVGDFGIGHDRRRIGIHQDDFVALGAQRLAGLRAGIVEFAGLADDDRAGADDQDFLDVSALWHRVSRRRSSHVPCARGVRARLCSLHHVGELTEQVVRVVRPGRSFGMILHAEKRQRAVAHALVGVVVQIHVRDFDVARRQRIGVDAETVILRGDFDLAGQQIFYRMIRTVMAEFQLEGLAAQRQAAELVAQADAEDRHAAQQLANVFDRVGDRLGIARTVREKYAVRLQREHVFGGSLGRDHGDVAMDVRSAGAECFA